MALRVLVGGDVEATLVGTGRDIPDPSGFGAVVVDGSPAALSTEWTERLAGAVRSGTSLVVICPPAAADASGERPDWQAIVGARCTDRLPVGEWMLRVAWPDVPLTRRLVSDHPATDELAVLDPGPDGQALLTVRVGAVDRPVVVRRSVGAGSVVVSGLGGGPATGTGTLLDPELSRLMHRALGPAAAGLDPERPLGVGVLGYGPFGGMGLYHGLASRSTPGLDFVAACDADPSRRKAAEAEFQGIRTFATAGDLAADDEVEIVVIATAPTSHAALGLEMLRAGKHVVLEKPMCVTLREADRLMAAAVESGTALTVNQSRRWDTDFRAVDRAVAGGLLGEVFNVETFVGGFEHPCREWHSERSISGGAVYDWGSHHLDWILQLMPGDPATVLAHGHKRVWRDVTNLDQVRVRLLWPDGREAEFVQSDIAGVRRPKFYVQGTAGTLVGHYRPVLMEHLEPGHGLVSEHVHHAEAPADLVLARYEPGYGLTETALPRAREDRYAFHRNLADHLHSGDPLAVTPQSARRVVALLEAAQRSTDAGNVPVQLVDPG